jgi:hypothetical protein
MNSPNRRTNGAVAGQDHAHESAPPVALVGSLQRSQFTPEQIKQFVAELDVPFDPSVVEWRVTNTSKGRNGELRGQVMPYADQRAYTDRLNALFSPAGWTRKYSVHTSANFQRDRDQKTTAKVFVTCELTIFGLGSHSATGEEWADAENAGTASEAQAFKRAAACFGLGRYLYYFTGVWVDLDDRKRPKTRPRLAGWATPDGWRQGLRPHQEQPPARDSSQEIPAATRIAAPGRGEAMSPERAELIRQLEGMAEPLGKRLYRGLLKRVARAWKPSDISEPTILRKLLADMQAGDRMLNQLAAILNETGPEELSPILRSLGFYSLEQVDNLDALQKILASLERKG